MSGPTPVTLGRAPAQPLSVRPGDLDPDERQRRQELRTALVAMPFASARRPSLALGLLSAIGREHGFPIETVHAHLEFAAMIGLQTSSILFEYPGVQVCEWMFSAAAFGDDAPADADDMMAAFGERIETIADHVGQSLGRRVEPMEILSISDRLVPSYLDRVEQMLDWGSFDVVGFTSTFQQNVASIAMARRLKAKYPDLVIVGGGANFEGPMGLEMLRSTPWFDFAVSGEADAVFPAFLASIAAGKSPASIKGVLTRHGQSVTGESAEQIYDMDGLPTPDFDEFFERAEQLGIVPRTGRRNTPIPYESSRGCWWGQKRHCTFCGLNGGTMEHRSKTPDRVLEELSDLTRRYRTFSLRAADNILDESYFDELLPVLIENETDFDLFYEIKANLDRPRVKLLADAGVNAMQPGIESLSSNVLRLRDKGIKASVNVNLLRWITHHGLVAEWNILYGFPGETDEDYAIQADLAERIPHLHPPLSVASFCMERFSPMFTDRDRFPVKRLTPERSYSFVYPPNYNLEELAYFFDHEFVDALPGASYERIKKTAAAWTEAWNAGPPTLEMWRSPDVIHIEDRRDPTTPVNWMFEGDLRAIYLACFDQPRSPRHVAEHLVGRFEPAQIEQALDGFVERSLMMRDGNLFLALALPPKPGTQRRGNA